MRKLFTLTLALLASFSIGVWGEAITKNYTFDDDVALTTDWTVSKDVPTGGTGTCEITTSINSFAQKDGSTKYLGLAYLNKSGINITITTEASYDNIEEISLDVIANDNGKPTFAAYIVPEEGEDIEVFAPVGSKEGFGTGGTGKWGSKTVTISPAKSGKLKIVTVASSSGKYAAIDNIKIKYTPAPSCNEAEDEGSFVAASTALTITDLVANPSTTLTFTKGDNKNEPSFAVTKDGETTADASVVGTTFSATAAGTYIVTATQAVDETNNICEVIKPVTITVTAEVPVTACSIEGPTAGIIGQELTYTATAANATAFAWYVDDALQEGETDAEFVYTGVKGNHSIYATATNAYTATPVASNPINLTVTKLCGELISYTAATASKAIDKDFTTTDGIIGGSGHQKSQSNAKLNSGGYYSLQLAEGSFIAGDVVSIYVTPEDSKVPPTLMISSNKNNTDVLGQVTDLTIETSNPAQITLTKGSSVIYLSRDGTVSSQNPIVSRISVSRSCEESDDASVKSLTVNGVAVAKDAELNKFEHTVSTNYAEENVTVAFTIHPLATSDKEGNTFTIPTPSAGDTNGASFKVTAEDGTQVTYTVFITKAASLSDDATLKELSVAGLTLAPAFDAETTAYTVTKAYEADMPAVDDVTATANDANAKSVDVALAGNVFTITVTAEDNTTKDYTITVNNAPAIKSLSRVLFSNGFDAFIDNTNRTVKAFYLDGTVAPTATTITAGANCTAGSIEDGKIVVTGADESFVEYAVTLEAVTANTNVVEESAAAGTFDGTEAWVKNGLLVYGNAAGFANNKYVLRRQHKGADPADDQRAIAGWVRTYFFVGNASKLQLTVTDNKKLKYAIDGGNYTTSDDASTLEINLEAGNHMIEIVTNQQSGDCTLSAPKLVKRTPTALDNTADEIKAVKFVENGQLFIRRGEKVYTITGEEVK